MDRGKGDDKPPLSTWWPLISQTDNVSYKRSFSRVLLKFAQEL